MERNQHRIIKHRCAYTPSHKALTDLGDSHFQRIADAVAELVDNSVRACRDVEKKEITISLYCTAEKKTAFLMVTDNGHGMTLSELEGFPVYAKDPASRGMNPESDDEPWFLSKFGVGAKQAGFYLGDRITVITKSAKENGFLKFCMDREVLKEREERSESNVFEDDISEYQIGDSKIFEDGDIERSNKSLISEIIQSQQQYERQYTMIIIHLKPDTRKKLLNDNKFYEMAESLEEIYYFWTHPEKYYFSRNIGKFNRNKKLIQPTSTDSFDDIAPVGKISYLLNGTEITDISTNNFIHKCLERAKAFEEFTVDIPENTMIDIPERLHAKGYLFYFPKIDGSETIPETKEPNSASIVKTFWRQRLVPGENVSNLKFFPSSAIIANTKAGIEWRCRVVTFLFLNGKFTFIANNKLRMCKEQDEWIGHRNAIVSMEQKDFKAWVQTCYKQFDKEFLFENRLPNLETEKNTFWSTCSLPGAMEPVKAGDEIKWENKGTTYFGKVLNFVTESTPNNHTSITSLGSFNYTRLPSATYGANNRDQEDVAFLKAGKLEIKPKDLAAVSRVSSVKFFLFPEKNPAKKIKLVDGTEVVGGLKYYKIGIQLYGSKNNDQPLFHLPDTSGTAKPYLVTLTFEGETSIESGTLYGYDASNDKDVEEKQISKPNYKELYHSFYDRKFQQLGTTKLMVKVLTPKWKDVVFTAQVEVNVKNPPIHDFMIKFAKDSFQLGKSLPAFTITFLDRDKRPTEDYFGKVTPSFLSDRLKFRVIKESKKNGKGLEFNERCQLVAMDGIWMAEPKQTDSPLIYELGDIQMEVTCQLREESNGEWVVAHEKTFPMLITAGDAYQMTILQAENKAIYIQNSERIPLLQLGFFDQYGNRTRLPASIPESSVRFEFLDGPLSFDVDGEKTKQLSARDRDGLLLTNIHCAYSGPFDAESGTKEINQKIILKFPNKFLPDFHYSIIPLLITSNEVPDTIQLFHNDLLLSNGSIFANPGDQIDLFMKVLSKTGNEIDFSNFSGRDSGSPLIICSWKRNKSSSNNKKKRSREQLSDDGRLPILQIPTDLSDLPSSRELDYSIDFEWCGFSLSTSFTVMVRVTPTDWFISTTDQRNHEIRNNSFEELHELCWVSLADAEGNLVSAKDCDGVMPLNPMLSVFVQLPYQDMDDDDDDDDEEGNIGGQRNYAQIDRIPLERTSQTDSTSNQMLYSDDFDEDPDESLLKFRIPLGFLNTLNAKGIRTGSKLLLSVSEDHGPRFRPAQVTLSVISGFPKRILLATGTHPSPSDQLMIDGHRLLRIPDLRVFFSSSDQLIDEDIVDENPHFHDLKNISLTVRDLKTRRESTPYSIRELRDLEKISRKFDNFFHETLESFEKKLSQSSDRDGSVTSAEEYIEEISSSSDDDDDHDDDEDDLDYSCPRVKMEVEKREFSGRNRERIPKNTLRFAFELSYSIPSRGNEPVKLPRAMLDVKIEKLNIVQSLRFIGEDIEEIFGHEDCAYEQTFSATAPPQQFQIELVTENKQPIHQLGSSSFQFSFHKERTSSSSSAEEEADSTRFDRLFRVQYDGHRNLVTIHPHHARGWIAPGNYQLTVSYQEMRSRFSSILSDKDLERKKSLLIRVTAGTPQKIRCLHLSGQSEHPAPLIKSQVSINSNDASVRTIARSIRLQLLDQSDNVCPLPANAHLTMTLSSVTAARHPEFAPELEAFTSERRHDGFFLPALQVKMNNKVQSSDYELVCTVSMEEHSPLTCRIPIHLTLSHDIFLRRQQLQDQIDRLSYELRHIEDQLDERDNYQIELQRYSDQLTSLSIEELSLRGKSLERQIAEAKQFKPMPKVVDADAMARRPMTDSVLGLFVDFCFAKDQKDIEVISWISRDWIDALVVSNLQSSMAMSSLGFKVLCLDNLGNLPTNLPRMDILENSGGNPRYIIDCIAFKQPQQPAMDYLGPLIFRDSILIDTVKDAMEYRRRFQEKYPHQPIPSVYTRNDPFAMVHSSGLLYSSNLDDPLRSKYGEAPRGNLESDQQELAVVRRVQLLKRRISESDSLEGKVVILQQNIAEAEHKMNSL